MKTAASSGGAGDLVYAIPIMRMLDVTRVYVKENFYNHVIPKEGAYAAASLYTTVKPLLEENGIEVLPTSGAYPIGSFDPDLTFDYNLDGFRKEKNRGKNHIMISYLNHFGLTHHAWTEPWLKVDFEPNLDQHPFYLVHLTSRWRENSQVDWKKVLASIPGTPFFIGFKGEHRSFVEKYGHIEYIKTDNLLEMAILIHQCEALYCNQSVSLAIAQSMGKKYFLERKPKKTNTLMYTSNENIL